MHNPRELQCRRGFTLPEAMIASAMLVILIQLAIDVWRRYLNYCTSFEAKAAVSAISRGAAAAYEREITCSETWPCFPNCNHPCCDDCPDFPNRSEQLCFSASAVPSAPPRGVYLPRDEEGADYRSGDSGTGWRCLRFALKVPQHYSYSYVRDGSALTGPHALQCQANCFEAAARGDLDGDGVISELSHRGVVDPHDHQLRRATEITVDLPAE